MGGKKDYVPDPDFYIKMRGAASTLMERGTCIVLELTGMHPTSLTRLGPGDLKAVGGRHYLYFRLPKPQRKVRDLRAPVPRVDLEIVRKWLERCAGRSRRWYGRVVAEVGRRAGYIDPSVSPMTYRAQRIVTLMDRHGSVHRVAKLTGARYSTIEDHYGKLVDDRYIFQDEDLLEAGDTMGGRQIGRSSSQENRR